MERRWRIVEGSLVATSFMVGGHEWISATTEPSTSAPVAATNTAAPTLTTKVARRYRTEAEGLHGTLTLGLATIELSLFPEVAGVTMRLSGLPGIAVATATSQAVSGIEVDEAPHKQTVAATDRCEAFALTAHHLTLTAVQLMDRTDIHDNLAMPAQYRLSPAEKLRLRGCLFCIEDPLTQAGIIFLKQAPLPHARPVKCDTDFFAHHRQVMLLCHGTGDTGEGYAWSTVGYRGGTAGRTAALHTLQRCFRPYHAGRDGLLLSNTWGDRNRDGRINEAFIGEEIIAAQNLGVDVVQIDDGWQQGITSNSVHSAKGGVWLGFWAADPQFWNAHPQRFPRGLTATATAARTAGRQFGLWFAPDSADDFSNWRKDADTILKLHREHGVNFVKIDGVKAHSKLSEKNLWRFFRAVLEETSGAVVFDQDVTAEIRPGYFGVMPSGPLFIENRYTDWGKYWPHATLRNIWQLSWWIDPTRLRMEFLNNQRNADKYGSDPLAPAKYGADYLFAITMIANPLAWFEVSSLPADYVAAVKPLIATWRTHRADLHQGTIIPIGNEPNGTQWTGFQSTSASGTHLLCFRELTDQATWTIPVTRPIKSITLLHGQGTVSQQGDHIQVTLDKPLSCAWVKVSH